MKKTIIKSSVILLLLTLALFLISGGVSNQQIVNTAQAGLVSAYTNPAVEIEATSEQLEREVIANIIVTPLYGIVNNNSAPKIINSERKIDDLNKFIAYYTTLSEEELLIQINANVDEVLELQRNGMKVVWNEDFLNNVISISFPDVYSKIIESQNSYKENINDLPISLKDLSIMANPGSNTVVECVDYVDILNIPLFEFCCRIYWAWDGDKITSVLPTTWGQVFMPGWHYGGVVANQQYFYDNKTAFYKWVKGYFYFLYESFNLTNCYPWQSFELHMGGWYYWNWGV